MKTTTLSQHVKIVHGGVPPDWANGLGLPFGDRQSGIQIKSTPYYKDFIYGIISQTCWPTGHAWLVDYCSIRRQPPTSALALPWHTDAPVVLGRRFGWTSGYVAWVPLTPITPSTPSLEICEWRQPLPHRGNRKTGYLESLIPPIGPVLRIENMALGDILLFDINLPHRTCITPAMNQTRFSMDLRFVKKVPKTYLGKVIEV
jgi:hypothetical protein